MPFNIGLPEVVLILAIALIVLGPKRLPEVGAALGKSIREFRKATTEVQEATSLTTPATATPAGAPAAAPAPNQLSESAVPNVLAEPAVPASPPSAAVAAGPSSPTESDRSGA